MKFRNTGVRRKMKKSESIKEIAGAMNKAQSEMSGAKKGASNPFFKSKYADMNSVVDAVRVPFSDNGLSYSQFPLFEDGKVGVETILMHDSGEWISSILLLPITKQDPQAAGSAITYAKRYALQSIAGIPSEDDDGQAAMGGKKTNEVSLTKKVNDALNIIPEQYNSANNEAVLATWASLNTTEQMQVWHLFNKDWQSALKAVINYKG